MGRDQMASLSSHSVKANAFAWTQPASTHSKAENSKRSKYPELVQRCKFEPIAIETSGVFGPSTRNIVHKIGKRITDKTGDKREKLWLKQHLNIAIQKGNALSIISSVKHKTRYS